MFDCGVGKASDALRRAKGDVNEAAEYLLLDSEKKNAEAQQVTNDVSLKKGDYLSEITHTHEFECPITMDIMEDPVIASDGFSYERSAIKDWLAQSDRSPVTNKKLEHSMLTSNHALRIIINEWKAGEE